MSGDGDDGIFRMVHKRLANAFDSKWHQLKPNTTRNTKPVASLFDLLWIPTINSFRKEAYKCMKELTADAKRRG